MLQWWSPSGAIGWILVGVVCLSVIVLAIWAIGRLFPDWPPRVHADPPDETGAEGRAGEDGR